MEEIMTAVECGVFQRFEEQQFYPHPNVLKRNLETHPFSEEIKRYLVMHQVPDYVVCEWPTRSGAVLSDLGIIRHMLAGNIIIYPFSADQLKPNSYDVRLGKSFRRHYKSDHVNGFGPFRSNNEQSVDFGDDKKTVVDVYNPFDGENVERAWPVGRTENAGQFERAHKLKLKGINPGDELIILYPEEMILAHTSEFIGGVNVVTTKISGKSTAGRNMIELCSDADCGNIGFFGRWTLEIKNKSSKEVIPLVIGQSYAQIVFLESSPCGQSYVGMYQNSESIKEVITGWNNEMMLPNMKRIA